MPFATDISKETKEKIALVVVCPRIRVTGWAPAGGSLYSVTFTDGVPVSIWNKFSRSGSGRFVRVATLAELVDVELFHYDHETHTLTVFAGDGNPDARMPLPADDYAGLTVEFELYLSTRPIYGRRDPLSSAFADIVEWVPAITEAPTASNGTSTDIFGFQPVNLGNIQVANDGWLNELLYEHSWYLAPIRAYMMVGNDYEKAVESLGVVQIFSGFVSAISETDKTVSLTCSDYTKNLDNPYELTKKFDLASFPQADPEASKAGEEWFVRKLYGAVEALEPVNVNHSSSPSTTNNRNWVTHLDEGLTPGTVTVEVDEAAANTATRTFFKTTPSFNVYDQVIITDSGTPFRVSVAAVNRALKYIDHAAIVRTVIAGDTCQRLFVGAVYIVDRDGNIYDLDAGDEFTPYVDAINGVLGFTLKNNVEASFLNTPFDPSQDKIYARVYGTKELELYEDLSAVGTLSRAAGVGADGVSLIFRVLRAAGFTESEMDTSSFQAVGADSHTMGFVVPESRDGKPQSYKDVIARLLKSQLWKLGLSSDGTGRMRIGLSAIQPFPAPFDYAVDKTEFLEFQWDHDYLDVYSEVKAKYKIPDAQGLSITTFQLNGGVVSKESPLAKHVHKVDSTYDIELAQFDTEEATTIAKRLMFILGDRRGNYRMRMPYTQLINARVGANYQVTRDHLPGLPYAFDAENARTLNLVEVQKDLSSVSLVLEDQKGVEDNSGDWS
jgi:hypothetical protein